MKLKLFSFFLLMALAGKLNAQKTKTTIPSAPPSDGRITMVIPQFQVIAANVTPDIAGQMQQLLVSNLMNDNLYHIIVIPSDYVSAASTSVGAKAVKKANYILQGKIIAYDEKESKFGFGGLSANLGKTIHYGFSFEVIDAKTNEMVLVKNWEFKVKAGSVGVSTASNPSNGNVTLDADVVGTYEKNLRQAIKYIEDQKSKIVLN